MTSGVLDALAVVRGAASAALVVATVLAKGAVGGAALLRDTHKAVGTHTAQWVACARQLRCGLTWRVQGLAVRWALGQRQRGGI